MGPTVPATTAITQTMSTAAPSRECRTRSPRSGYSSVRGRSGMPRSWPRIITIEARVPRTAQARKPQCAKLWESAALAACWVPLLTPS